MYGPNMYSHTTCARQARHRELLMPVISSVNQASFNENQPTIHLKVDEAAVLGRMLRRWRSDGTHAALPFSGPIEESVFINLTLAVTTAVSEDVVVESSPSDQARRGHSGPEEYDTIDDPNRIWMAVNRATNWALQGEVTFSSDTTTFWLQTPLCC